MAGSANVVTVFEFPHVEIPLGTRDRLTAETSLSVTIFASPRNFCQAQPCYVDGMPSHRLLALLMIAGCASAQSSGILLEDLTWPEAEKILTPQTIVVIPIGAESKEHGPHLKLKNDFLMAEYLKREVLKRSNVVVAPTVNYHYYPAFVEYPGSTTLRIETARDLLVDICRSLARYGPRRFYALNTGVSTIRALRLSADVLAADGILFRYTDILKVGEAAEKQVKQEEGGTHADEIETSMMLYIAPETVDMKKAVKDYHPSGKGGLTRNPNGEGAYSASGIYGDATLATRQKGEIMINAMLDGIVKEIEALRSEK
jgi:creatinine amidohydrolase